MSLGVNGALLLLVAATVQDPAPIARARVEPSEAVTVGQPVSIVVEVLVPSYFMGAPRFPDLEVADALVVFDDRGANFTERVAGQTFAGQSRRYTVYPQRPGVYEVAEIPIAVRFFSGGATDDVVSPPPVRFRAVVPSGAEDLDPFVATTRLTLEEVYEPEPVELTVGDAFVRSVTVTVDGALAMVIPPLAFEAPTGLAVYPEPPLVTDSGGERGSRIVGQRVERASYVAEAAGSYRLPAIELEWWDVANARRMSATAPALDLVVVESDIDSAIALPEDSLSTGAEEREAGRQVSLLARLQQYGPWIALVVALVWAVVRVERSLAPRLARARQEARDSERAYFARFRDAALSGDPRATARTFMAWLDRRNESGRTAQFHDFAAGVRDPVLDREAWALGSLLYGDDDESSWSGGRLYRRVARARSRREEDVERSGLPPLNP